MPYGITRCYLPPGRDDVPALTPAKLVLDIATQERCKAELTKLAHYYYIASAAVAVDSSHMTAPSSASWSRFSLIRIQSDFVNGHVSTTWFMVCRIVGSVTLVWSTTEADDQSSLHCVIVSTDVTPPVTFLPLPQQSYILDLATQTGCKAELT